MAAAPTPEPPAGDQPRRRSPARRSLAAASSREASDQLLAVLRDGGWRPRAWVSFIALATVRSVDAGGARPRALVESTIIHLPFLLLSRGSGRVWVLTSWLMAVTHLGMLGERTTLGVPNVLTLVRGNLPAVDHLMSRALPIISLATDFADGKIARRTGTVTSFGAQADFLADTAFWTWFIARHEPSRAVKLAALAAWAAPVIGVTAASISRGRMVDLPRAWWFRPAAIVEVLIGARAIWRLLHR